MKITKAAADMCPTVEIHLLGEWMGPRILNRGQTVDIQGGGWVEYTTVHVPPRTGPPTPVITASFSAVLAFVRHEDGRFPEVGLPEVDSLGDDAPVKLVTTTGQTCEFRVLRRGVCIKVGRVGDDLTFGITVKKPARPTGAQIPNLARLPPRWMPTGAVPAVRDD